MRDKEKKVWCLNCNLQVMSEEEFNNANKSQIVLETKANESKQEIPPTIPLKHNVVPSPLPPLTKKEQVVNNSPKVILSPLFCRYFYRIFQLLASILLIKQFKLFT